MCRRRALGVGGGARDAPPAAATAPRLLVVTDQDSEAPPMDITHCASLAVARDALPIVNAAPADLSIQELAPHPMHSGKLKAALCQSPGGAGPSVKASARHFARPSTMTSGSPRPPFPLTSTAQQTFTACGAQRSSLQRASAYMRGLRNNFWLCSEPMESPPIYPGKLS